MSLMLPALAGGFFTTSTTWEAQRNEVYALFILKTFWKDTAPPLSGYCFSFFFLLAGIEGGILPINLYL